ncbi:FAD-binding oxidoreductase [Archangium violaceum]|uniref:NAD(P)/FAD-dependent oxidoreductase n=1 Tax=Archangium violaceum TaxID=83451 RepID=UPI001951FF75|nr:FAD-dependent oxidoreductase [Archangium violaceum]QRO01333.1 FAD-binding oxidoreductase [Archangium violaceum]
MSETQDILVLGAGVMGLSVARRLAALGARVTVLDPVEPGGQGSRAAAGVAIPSVRLLDDPDMLAFTRAAHGALTEELASLGEGLHLRRGQGVLRVAMDAKGRDALGQKAASHPEWLGTWMDAAHVVELEPALEGTPLLGAFVTEQGYMVDTEAYLNALLHDVHRRGVRVRLGEGARSVAEVDGGVEVRTEHETLRAGRLVVCAGAWSGGLVGLPALPVKPVRGQMLTIFHPEVRLTRVVSGPTYLAPWRAGEIVVGATEEDAGFACHVTPTGLMHLGATVAKLAPRLREARFVRAWAGLRSVAPGSKPLIGRYPGTKSVLIASGHAGQGILTSALTGRAVAELIEHGHSEVAAAFEPERVLASASERF